MPIRLISLVILLSSVNSFSASHADEPTTKEKNAVAVEAPLFGRITDELGAPVTDARLTLRGSQYLTAETDDEGRYAFLDLAEPGRYRLRIESQGWVGFADYREQIEIDVAFDRNTRKDLTLQRACQLKIKVVDEDNIPVIATVSSHSVQHDRFSKTIHYRTKKHGIATIGGIPRSKAKQIVFAESSGFALTHLYADVQDPTVVGEHTIVMKPGKTIRGKAVCSDGNPPAGWHIYSRPTWYKFGAPEKAAEIGKDGSFELTDVGDDPQNVLIKIPTSDGNSTAKFVLRDAVLTKLEQPINVKLDHPSPASLHYLTCNVRWIGKPADRGFAISGYCQDLDDRTDHFIKANAKQFKLGPMPAGIYRFRLDSGQIELMNLRGIKNLDKLDQVKVPNDEPIQIVVRAKGKPHLQGTVIDAATKKPITSFQMRVTKVKTLSGPNYVTGNEWEFFSDKNGQFFYDVPGPGVYYTRILADGYAIKQSIEVNTDETPDKMMEIALDKGMAVSGRVVDGDGNGVAEAKVRAVSLAGGSYGDDIREFVTDMGAVRTSETGEFKFEHLAKGYDQIRVDHDEYVYAVTSISIKEELKPVKIVLKEGATIQGTVYDQHGEPAKNEPIFFHKDYNFSGSGDDAPGLFAKTITDDDGRFTVKHIPERLVYISRDSRRGVQGLRRRAMKTSEGQMHTIDLGGTSKMTGQLRIDGQPLGDSRIKLTGDDSVFGQMAMYGNTDADGTFTLHGAPPGHWILYRGVIGSRGDWVRLCRVDVPVDGNVQLGTLNAPTGTLTLKFNSDLPLPAKIRVDLQQHNDVHDIGRTAARQVARKETTDPRVFQGVVPGDYDLEVNFDDFEIRKRVKIAPDDLNKEIEFESPIGKANVRVTLLNKDDKPSGATVRLWSADGLVSTRMKPQKDKDGNPCHEVTGLADGKYVIRSYFQQSGPVLGELEIVNGKDVTEVIKLPEKLTSPNVNLDFTVFDEQGVHVRAEIDVVSKDTMTVRQGGYARRQRLIVPKGSTFTAKIQVEGYETFEQEFESIEKHQSIEVVLKIAK